MNTKTIIISTLITVVLGGCADDARPPRAKTTDQTSLQEPPVNAPGQRVRKAETMEGMSASLRPEERDVFAAGDVVGASASMPAYNVLAATREATVPPDRENYEHFDTNPIKISAEEPVSTFSIDVDTGSYSNVRRMLNEGRLPVQDAVRVEELLNYFDYDYPPPTTQDPPFRVTTEFGPNPWNTKTRLLHIGIAGYSVPLESIPAANLVFLIDVSGSMQSPDKLDLLKKGMKLLVSQMRPQDRISIVVYAGSSGVVLEPTPGDQKFKIDQALDQLTAGGSTNGAEGIRLAYQVAASSFIKDGVNRVLLATDGDFNVGTTSFEQLMDLVEEKRKSGIGLSTLGFGTGNYNDHLAEQLADRGNGSYAYIDTLNEANKVLSDQLSSTLMTIAKDVKIQVEFNPAVVSEYRLVGYENRQLRREDFNNDKIDAGDIGAGHTVTALYEVTLKGTPGRVDPLRYSKPVVQQADRSDEAAFVRLRYKAPNGDTSKLIELPVTRRDLATDLAKTSERYRFAAAVAGFGQVLRGGEYLQEFGLQEALNLARGAKGLDPNGYRGEFLQLVNLAQALQSSVSGASVTQSQTVE